MRDFGLAILTIVALGAILFVIIGIMIVLGV